MKIQEYSEKSYISSFANQEKWPAMKKSGPEALTRIPFDRPLLFKSHLRHSILCRVFETSLKLVENVWIIYPKGEF